MHAPTENIPSLNSIPNRNEVFKTINYLRYQAQTKFCGAVNLRHILGVPVEGSRHVVDKHVLEGLPLQGLDPGVQ